MIPKRELTQEQIEEIQALRGRLSAGEVKKRFVIGSTRLYKIWRDVEPAQNVLLYGKTAQTPIPTVEDLYKRLEGLEARAEQSTRLLVEVMPQLVHNNEQEEERDELEEECEEEAQTETRMDIQKVGQIVETAQKWTHLSLAGILVWKVVRATLERRKPAAEHDAVQQQKQTAAPPPSEAPDPRNPHYME